jgi:O-antigen/teichoic acid export membrane protein
MKQRQSRLSGALALSLAQASVLMFGYVTHLWIGRKLGPAQYGVYGVVLSVQSILGMFLTLGVPSSVSRFVAQDTGHAGGILRQALSVQTVIGLLLAAASILSAPLIAHFLGDSSLSGYLMFSGIVILFQAHYPIFAQFFSGLHQFNRQAIITFIYATAKLVGAISLLYTFHVYGAFAGFAIGGIVAALVGWWWSRGLPSDSHRLPLKSLLAFASTYVAMLVGLQILMSIDLFMVKAILGSDQEAGYYNAAVTLSRIPYFLLQALTFILLPSISALTKPGESHEKAADFIRQALRYLIILIVPGIVFAATTSRQLITLFYSKQYLPAAPVLTILMIGLGALAFYLMLINIVAGAGRAKVGVFVTAAMLIISPLIGIIAIPRFGLIGAAWQTASAGIIGCIVLAIYTFKTFAIPVPLRSIINVIIATAIAIIPTYLYRPPTLLLPVFYAVLFVIYGLSLWFLQEISAADRTYVSGLHPRLRWIAPSL